MDEKWRAQWSMVSYFKKREKNPGDYLGSTMYQLIITANQSQFNSNRAGLAVLINW